jgi:ankyrin repeat protein
VRYLIEHSADPNVLDDNQNGPLYASLACKHVEVANILLDSGANPKAVNKNGETALHEAARLGNEALVRKLLNAECDGLYASKSGWTPFMSAVYSRKLEVVNALLEHNFNGTAIPDYSGRTCIHVAANTGSIEMLNKLTVSNKQIALVTDSAGSGALESAAAAGQVDMIEPLIELGLDSNGSKLFPRNPLRIAAAAGYYDFVCRLIDLGADVNERTGLLDLSPLNDAIICRRSLIAERLVKAGADPTYRDALGLSSLDYAFRDALVWKKMGDARDHYSPIELQKRMPTLQNTVQKCVAMILALPQKQNPKTEFEKMDCLEVLSMTLLEMRSGQSREHARMCYIELASPPNLANFFSTWACYMCKQTPLRGTRYVCVPCACESTFLCSLCHSDYLEGGGTPKSAPQSLKILQKLENDLKPIRELAKIFLHFRGKFLTRSCEKLVIVVEWVNEKLKAYEEWEEKYNTTGRFNSYKRPGQELLKIIKMARQADEEKEKEGGNTKEDPFAKIEEELAELYREHKPDKELDMFICSGHEYLEVRDKTTMKDADRVYFDANGKLTTEWLSDLLEIYQNDRIENEAGEDAEPLRLPNPELDSPRTNSKADESKMSKPFEHEINPTEEILLLTEALTDEPAEIGGNTSTVKRESSGSLDESSKSLEALGVDRQDKSETNIDSMNETRSRPIPDKSDLDDNHEKNSADQLTSKEATASNTSDSFSANRERLKNIQRALMDKVVHLLKGAKALDSLSEAASEGEQDSNQPSGKSDDATSQHGMCETSTREEQNQLERPDKEDRNVDNANQEAKTDEKEENASDPDDDDESWQLTLGLELIQLEIAWNFAQIILIHSVETHLIMSLDNSEDEKNDGVLYLELDHGISPEGRDKVQRWAKMARQEAYM